MRTETRTERIGEWLGPVDWTYDFNQHTSVNSDYASRGAEELRKLEADPGGWYYTPCFLVSNEVVEVGMYDGWPFWKPTPAIGYIGPLGSVEIAFFYNLGGKLFKREPSDSP